MTNDVKRNIELISCLGNGRHSLTITKYDITNEMFTIISKRLE